MKRYLAIIIGLIIVFGTVSFFSNKWELDISPNNREITCRDINPDRVTIHAQTIENRKMDFATTSRQIFGRSTDGGVQLNYYQNGDLLLVEVGLFGETTRTDSSYFLEDSKVYYVHREITKYKKSIYHEDFDPNEKSVASYDYYLDKYENLCYGYLDGESSSITSGEGELIEDVISIIR